MTMIAKADESVVIEVVYSFNTSILYPRMIVEVVGGRGEIQVDIPGSWRFPGLDKARDSSVFHLVTMTCLFVCGDLLRNGKW